MFVVDYPNLHEKVVPGDKILVDYGGLIFTVIGFESESKFLS
jgi:pyruvate kinase